MPKTKRKSKAVSESDEEFEVSAILSHRGARNNRQFLVSWKGYSAADNSWTDEENLGGCEIALANYWASVAKRQAESEAQLNKAKTVAANVNRPGSSSSSNKRRHKEESLEHGVSAAVEENENEDPAAAAAVLAKYMSMEVWDEHISQVVTVMREISGELRFYVVWEDGQKSWVDESLMNVRAPQQVIQFYKSHLKFKSSAQS